MQIHYLEIVTLDVDALCKVYQSQHDVSFDDPEPALGNARVAEFSNGGRIGIRAPMHADEQPVIRPYTLVDDIDVATKGAEDLGAEIIHPPMEIPGFGKFSICLTGPTQHGFWQL
jgi:predicted enzyme related to lactoylglutathione lyase